MGWQEALNPQRAGQQTFGRVDGQRSGHCLGASLRGRAATLRGDVLGARLAADAEDADVSRPSNSASVPDLGRGRGHGQHLQPPQWDRADQHRNQVRDSLRPPPAPQPSVQSRRGGRSTGSDRIIGRDVFSGKAMRERAEENPKVLRSPTFHYLRLFGLAQYAQFFFDEGVGDLSTLAHLPDGDALDILERIQLYPGHRAKLLRALAMLRQATVLGGTGCTNGELTGELRDAQTLGQLCERMEMLVRERDESEEQNKVLREENHHLIIKLRQQGSELEQLSQKFEQMRQRNGDLEQLVWAQTEQVGFLASQLQRAMEQADTQSGTRASDAERVSRANDQSADRGAGGQQASPEYRAHSEKDAGGCKAVRRDQAWGSHAEDAPVGYDRIVATPSNFRSNNQASPSGGSKGAARKDSPERTHEQPVRNETMQTPDGDTSCFGSSPELTSAAKVALHGRPLVHDTKFVRRVVEGSDPKHVDSVAQCLAAAIHNKILLQAAGPVLSHHVCESVFREPHADRARGPDGFAWCGGGPRLHAPGKQDIYDHVREVMVAVQVPVEAAVIAFVYLDRLKGGHSVIALTPENWRRLTVAVLLLGYRVCDRDAYEDAELAQILHHRSFDDIVECERSLAWALAYDVSVTEAEYNKACFLLRTLGGRDVAAFNLPPLGPDAAAQLAERCEQYQADMRAWHAPPPQRGL
mmetsp:Transcript_15837/g.43326  ORF Transcript_15837/g.43326 Transcript_15837/m.43326 type:complete len:696 (+) Transcript_15837:78-2165(+)